MANPAGQGDVQHQVLGVLVFKQELLTACGLVLLRLNTIRATIFTEALFSRKCRAHVSVFFLKIQVSGKDDLGIMSGCFHRN